MGELVVWLGQQLDEDERIAREAIRYADPDWHLDSSENVVRAVVSTLSGKQMTRVTSNLWRRPSIEGRGVVPHVATHDPARVLREVEAKRQLLADLLPAPMESATDDELHARSAHPAYEYRTTEGPRKQWDDADRPPSGDAGEPDPGWERNTAAGRGGWERFDLTEESYWRRRLPVGQERKPQAPQWLRRMAAVYADRPGYRSEWRP
jgi:hypothetical protein